MEANLQLTTERLLSHAVSCHPQSKKINNTLRKSLIELQLSDMLPSEEPQPDCHREPEVEIPASNINVTSPVSTPPIGNEFGIHTMQNPEVIFSPPLYEQRRAWILGVLRHEQVTSVSTYCSNAFE